MLAGLGYLRAPGPPPEDQAEVLVEMQQAVEHMAKKVAAMRMLDQSDQGPAAALEPLALGALIEEAWSRAAPALAKVKAEHPPLEGLARVLGVASLLEGALTELLLNAAETGGAVRVRVEVEVAHVVVSVEDAGPGLSADVEAHLFEPFFTTRGPSRSGLGLAVAREQVLRCGGSLEGANRREGGARFTLRLQQENLSLRQRGETLPAEPPTTSDESSLSPRGGEGRGEGRPVALARTLSLIHISEPTRPY